MIDLLPAGLLGRHVGDRADRSAGLRDAFYPGQLRQPEVEDLHDAGLGHQQVGGLDVPMHDARAVGFRQPLADLRGDVESVGECHRSTGDPVLERLPLVVRHDKVQLPVVCLVDLKDGADVGVVQRRGGLGLLQEALLGGLVSGQVGREELDGGHADLAEGHAPSTRRPCPRSRAGRRWRTGRGWCLRKGSLTQGASIARGVCDAVEDVQNGGQRVFPQGRISSEADFRLFHATA